MIFQPESESTLLDVPHIGNGKPVRNGHPGTALESVDELTMEVDSNQKSLNDVTGQSVEIPLPAAAVVNEVGPAVGRGSNPGRSETDTDIQLAKNSYLKKELDDGRSPASREIRNRSLPPNGIDNGVEDAATGDDPPATPPHLPRDDVFSSLSDDHPFQSVPIDTLSEVSDENELDENDEQPPLHHRQLIDLYGSEWADYFINPKPVEVQRISRHESNLAKQRHVNSAMLLWDTLREDSIQRLEETDAVIQPTLKNTYDAFMREKLHRGEAPIARSFCPPESMTELNKLRRSKKKPIAINRFKRRLELMFRNTHLNEQQYAEIDARHTAAAAANFADEYDPVVAGGGGRLNSYIPSWTEVVGGTDHDHVVDGDSMKEPKFPPPPATVDVQSSPPIAASSSKMKMKSKQKLSFWTDDDTECAGQFRDKFVTSSLVGGGGGGDAGSQHFYDSRISARCQSDLSDGVWPPSSRGESASHGQGATTAAAVSTDHELAQTLAEPLSLNALSEYKKEIPPWLLQSSTAGDTTSDYKAGLWSVTALDSSTNF